MAKTPIPDALVGIPGIERIGRAIDMRVDPETVNEMSHQEIMLSLAAFGMNLRDWERGERPTLYEELLREAGLLGTQ